MATPDAVATTIPPAAPPPLPPPVSTAETLTGGKGVWRDDGWRLTPGATDEPLTVKVLTDPAAALWIDVGDRRSIKIDGPISVIDTIVYGNGERDVVVRYNHNNPQLTAAARVSARDAALLVRVLRAWAKTGLNALFDASLPPTAMANDNTSAPAEPTA